MLEDPETPNHHSGGVCALHQINEEDLAALERTLPQLSDALTPILTNRLRMKLRQVQRIISNVRWNYGPPTDVEVIPANDG